MDNGGEQDKSEQATPFKLKQARDKGTIARSMDLAFAAGLAAILGYFWMAGESFVAGTMQGMRLTLAAAPQIVGDEGGLFPLIALLFASVAKPIALMAGTVFLIVLLFELLQTGVIFSAHPLKPDFSRINPAKGFKRIFSWPMMVNALKNVFKLVVYGLVAWLAIRRSFVELAPAIVDGQSLIRAIGGASSRLAVYFLGVAICFAALDQMLVRRNFSKQMRMSRRDVRRESRDREGEPRMKQKRKGLHAEFVANAKSLRGMRSADMLVVNPIHYAVGLRYDQAVMAAPQVVALGMHGFALRLKRAALLYGVPVIEDPELARALYRSTRIDQPISEDQYQGAAKHYRVLRGRKAQGTI